MIFDIERYGAGAKPGLRLARGHGRLLTAYTGLLDLLWSVNVLRNMLSQERGHIGSDASFLELFAPLTDRQKKENAQRHTKDPKTCWSLCMKTAG